MKILSIGTDNSALDKNSKLSKRISEYKKIVNQYDVIVPKSKNKIISLIKICNLSIKLLKKEKYDIITVQDQYFLALLGWFLARKFKIGLELQIHGFEKNKGIKKLIAKFVIPRANAIRTVSQRLKKQLINEFGVKEEKITVMPIYTEISNLKTQNSKLKRDNGKFIFLTVGRLVLVKNIGLQIEAIKEVVKSHNEAELWIMGDGQEKSKIKSQIANLKLENNVKLLGWQNDLNKFYNQADVFLLTSDCEGWGIVVIEAASFGLPIIMTDVGCAGELIKNNESGIIIPVRDKNKLIEAMIKIIENTELRERIGLGALLAIKKLSNKEETLKLYKQSWEKAII